MLNITTNLDQLFQTAMEHHQAGRLAQAEPLYRHILQQNPGHADTLHMMGLLAFQFSRHEAAAALFRQAIACKPNNAESCCNLGNVLAAMGQFEQAIPAFRQSIVFEPNFPEAHHNLGNALKDSGQLKEAIAAYRQAIALNPDFSQAYSHLANTLRQNAEFDAALDACRRAIALQSNFPEAYVVLGNTLAELGQAPQAIAAYRQAVALNPHYQEGHSNLIFALHYLPVSDAQTTAEEHRLWNRKFAQPLQKLIRPHANERDPKRRLRIGYVSPDFHDHAVAPMVLPLLANHDHARYEIFCYAQVLRPDAWTQRFHKHADHWRNTVGSPDQLMADQIRQDKIDILVDLAGHTGGNRLLVLAQKPAPVQVTRQGYPDTTGLETIDYRMSDADADPPGLSDTWHSEKIIRLPQTNWIYQPPAEAMSLAVTPLDPDAPITFGCFNNFAKVTEPMLHLWAGILTAVPGSKFLLKGKALAAESLQQRLRALFTAQGLAADRLETVTWSATPAEHLQLYRRVTIALDPFPYHGTTTTCEALWMGVPVITLAGPTHVSRVGVSLLSNMGLPELIAQTPEEYVRIAVNLAGNRARLAELRSTLRRKLQASPIMDHVRFARQIEEAYRSMWRKWCTEAPS